MSKSWSLLTELTELSELTDDSDAGEWARESTE